jgi:mannose-1-phosphate guanylyltransferase
VGLNTSIHCNRVKIEGPDCTDSNVHIVAGAAVTGPAWAGHGCRIRTDITAARSVLFECNSVATDLRFNEMSVSPEYSVDRQGDTLHRKDGTAQLQWGDAGTLAQPRQFRNARFQVDDAVWAERTIDGFLREA